MKKEDFEIGKLIRMEWEDGDVLIGTIHKIGEGSVEIDVGKKWMYEKPIISRHNWHRIEEYKPNTNPTKIKLDMEKPDNFDKIQENYGFKKKDAWSNPKEILRMLNEVAEEPIESAEERLEYLEDKSRKIDVIQQRIQDEYRKHKHNPDIWSRMAAVKIYHYLEEYIGNLGIDKTDPNP